MTPPPCPRTDGGCVHLHSPPAGRRPPERGAALGAVEPHPERQVRARRQAPVSRRCRPAAAALRTHVGGTGGGHLCRPGASAPAAPWQACAERGLLQCPPPPLLSPTAGPVVTPPSTRTEPSSGAGGAPAALRPWPHPRLRLLSAVLAVEKGGRRLGWGGPRVGQERVARLAGRSGLGRGGQAVSLLCLRSGVGVPLGGCWLQGVSRHCPRDSQTGKAREPGLRAPSSQRQSGATLGLWPLWQRWPPR